MTEVEFLENWLNDVSNEFDEKADLEYSEKEVLDILMKWKNYLEENNFIFIVEDHKGRHESYFSTRSKAMERINYIQDSRKKPLVVNCQKVY